MYFSKLYGKVLRGYFSISFEEKKNTFFKSEILPPKDVFHHFSIQNNHFLILDWLLLKSKKLCNLIRWPSNPQNARLNKHFGMLLFRQTLSRHEKTTGLKSSFGSLVLKII